MIADRSRGSNAPDTWYMSFSGAHTSQTSFITGFPKKLVPGTGAQHVSTISCEDYFWYGIALLLDVETQLN